GKWWFGVIRSHNVFWLRLGSLIHSLNVLYLQPDTAAFGEFVATRVEEYDGQLTFAFVDSFKQKTLFRVAIINICPVIAFENKRAVCIYCLLIVFVSNGFIEYWVSNLRLRAGFVP